MRKRVNYCLLACSMIMMTGCGETSAPSENPASEVSDAIQKTKDDNSYMESTAEDSGFTDATVPKNESADDTVGSSVGLYDRTYLVEKGGTYIYSMRDTDIIEKYDELYAEAFMDTSNPIEDYKNRTSQGSNKDIPYTVNGLVLRDTLETEAISVGSYFEEDFNFEYNRLGYTYVDLNSDGSFELIFGVINPDYPEDVPEGSFERAYTLVDGKPVKFCEVGNRNVHWLGNDGYIYEKHIGGYNYWGIERLHFDPSEVVAIDEEMSPGSSGLIGEEFVGCITVPVHVMGPLVDSEEERLQQEYAISEEEQDALYDEWNSRRVRIDWLNMSDYVKKNSLTDT